MERGAVHFVVHVALRQRQPCVVSCARLGGPRVRVEREFGSQRITGDGRLTGRRRAMGGRRRAMDGRCRRRGDAVADAVCRTADARYNVIIQ